MTNTRETSTDGATDKRFPRRNRLLHSLEFQTVFTDTRCKSSDRYFTLLARHNNLPYPRLGLAITKKKIKTAVGRHSIKRVVRESFRQHKDILAGLDIVVLASTAAGEAGNPALFQQLHKHWRTLTRKCTERV